MNSSTYTDTFGEPKSLVGSSQLEIRILAPPRAAVSDLFFWAATLSGTSTVQE